MDLAELYNAGKARGWSDTPKGGSVRASAIIGCLRKLALHYQGYAAPYKDGSSVLSEGVMHEQEIVARLKELGVGVAECGSNGGWFQERVCGVLVRGQVDGVLPEYQLVLEVKTTGNEVDLDRMMSPKDSWLYQGELYARVLGLRGVLYFAKARDTGKAKQWVVSLSNSRWSKIQAQLEALKQVGDPWMLDIERLFECRWCAWEGKCWPATDTDLANLSFDGFEARV